ncbi:NosD domain-containing protein [Wenzhouxiangella marina]|nr:right-handed parallel beta-helix repeat-containing protein [Wenzhouxiangella marina]MBB6088624.1 CSLREA domain-containing protein [Wenzhouxiangella marina]
MTMFKPFLFALALAFSVAAPAATFVVNDLGDDPDANPGDGICDIPAGGPPRCTLRAAIMEANTTPVVDFVEFSLGLIVINITGTPLPTITAGLWIDATTAPGYNAGAESTLDAPPSVYINGSALTGTTADGLRSFNTDNLSVEGLGIINFPDNGIEFNNGEPALIDSNWIGVTRTGGIAGNGGSGVYLNGVDRATVGRRLTTSPEPDRGNVISNNGEHGIYLLLGEDADIAGNYIGVDPVGGGDFGNGLDGIRVVGPNNQIGGIVNTSERGNVVENNGGTGIYTQAGNNLIYSNAVRFNQGDGIRLNGANSRIGFTSPQLGNLVSENGGHGVQVGNDFASSGNLIRYLTSVNNSGRGLWIVNGDNNEVRDSSFAVNGDDAVRVDGTNSLIVGNEIGLLDGGLFGNTANGIVLANDGNVAQSNLIGGVSDDGIDVPGGIGNQVLDNYIGVRENYADIGVGNAGVRVQSGAGSTLIQGNRIGFNSDGIALMGSGTRICANFIGVGEGNQNIGNAVEGVRIDGGGNVVGDLNSSCVGNLIGFNASDGVQISGDANTVRDNTIGGVLFTDLGNLNAGVFLANGSDLNLIEGNQLHHNGNDGIRVAAGAGTRNRFDSNEFGENGDQSIDLGDNGPTANDAGDGDSGANNLQNYPEITSLASVGGQLEIRYRVDSSLANSNYPLTIDFYIEANLQRDIYRIHRDTYNLAPGSERTIMIAPPFPTSLISAMVIDSEGNSSELSPALPYEVIALPDMIFNDRFEQP